MTGLPLHARGIAELGAAIREGDAGCVAVAEQMLARIDVVDRELHSYVTVTRDRALRQAERLDRELASGRWRGPLHGVPVAVKDLFFTHDAVTACGTKALREWVPDFDATVVERLEAAGAVVLGKLAMGEGAVTPHPELPAAVNPWNADYWPGASSSGSGAACAAGLCFGALGTDTGGSIRFPSSACGLAGMKPTYGRISRHGVFPLAESLDHVGPMARSVADAHVLFDAILGDDPEDSTMVAREASGPAARSAGDGRMRIGFDPGVEQYAHPDVLEIVRQALEAFTDLGGEIVEVRLPDPTEVRAAFETILATEVAHAHRDLFARCAADYGPALQGLVERGLAVSGTDYAEALRQRPRFRRRYAAALAEVDAVVLPVAPTPTPTLAAFEASMRDPLGGRQAASFTAPFNLCGLPSLTVPAGFTANGLPLGVQLAGAPFAEERLFELGKRFEQHPVGMRVPTALRARLAG